ncbi:DUF1566 domain-containing protein [Methylosinus sp. Sm6]|uniref:Lcl C-terminal domain-containing protein n=1 Tax=Methylosinus sp. Sm6 TaxID=2866948 RepID=UPI001C998DDB|nr:DUF1566 domain-containing protein [Methylosinus sp. Sm6]MBY6239942.1 DUF1566 domain-containing protein [Methylosinus sp. Sm6]
MKFQNFLLLACAAATQVAPAFAAHPICGNVPEFTNKSEESNIDKGDLKAAAEALSKKALNIDISGNIDAERKTIYNTSDKNIAAQKDAYFQYMMCVLVMDDKQMATEQKLKLITDMSNANVVKENSDRNIRQPEAATSEKTREDPDPPNANAPRVASSNSGAALLSNTNVALIRSPAKPLETSTKKDVELHDRFVTQSCGYISDMETDLDWIIGPNVNMAWNEARDWVGAQAKSKCGGNWRLPTVDQLESLYDQRQTAGQGYQLNGKSFPAHIDPAFSAIGGGSWVWTKEEKDDNLAVSFNFNRGIPVSYSKLNTEYSTRAFGVRRATR